MFQIGDFVTRNSYNNDIIFKIIEINAENYILKGVNIRLIADSSKDDLKIYGDESPLDDEINISIDNYKTLDRSEYFYMPGKILHIDSDKEYLERCLHFYKKNRVKAFGMYESEEEVPNRIREYLEKYSPDIVVITGHDAYYRKQETRRGYKNTDKFVSAVKEARKYEKDHEKLIIIAGACQSNYEELIKAGSNFASSPKRINIHALDPAIIAASLSFADKHKDIDLISILNRTKYGVEGMGGIITKGTMYVGFPRE